MERVEEQEDELRRLSNLIAEHQAILRILPERPEQQFPPIFPPRILAQLRGKVEDVLPATVNIVRGPHKEQVKFLTWVICPHSGGTH